MVALAVCSVSAVIMATAQSAAPSIAQTYPSGPVRMLVPFGAGGATDVVARVFAERLQQRMGQPLSVVTRGGAEHRLNRGRGEARHAARAGGVVAEANDGFPRGANLRRTRPPRRDHDALVGHDGARRHAAAGHGPVNPGAGSRC